MFGKTTYPYSWSNQSTAVPMTQPQQNGIIWVQGEAGAKSFLVAPGQSVLLMDSESNVFYIKSSDASGMPMPLRIFDYTERIAVAKNETTAPTAEYITREEFEKRLSELNNAKQPLQSTERKPKYQQPKHD